MQYIDVERAHWKEIKDARIDMAILPWGATEPHNLHLPYGTDTYSSRAVAREAVSLIPDHHDLTIAILPAVPYGVNTGQRDLNLCMSIRPSVQLALLTEIVSNLADMGIPKLIIVNGHGGNNFKPLLRELQQTHPSVFCCFTNWWTIIDAHEYFCEPGDHAGEMETSLMQYIQPELVLPLSEAGDGKSRMFVPAGLSSDAVWAPRHWRSVSDDTGVGNPAESTPEKGKSFFTDASRVLALIIADIASTPKASLYQ